jgi:hypothetical protein
LRTRSVVPRASPKSGEHSEFRVITKHAEPLRKSTHFLHQYTSPFTTLPSVLFYKEGLYVSTQHRSKHWRGSLFTGSPHHHLVRVGVNTSILILIVSILLYFLQTSLIAYAIRHVNQSLLWSQMTEMTTISLMNTIRVIWSNSDMIMTPIMFFVAILPHILNQNSKHSILIHLAHVVWG